MSASLSPQNMRATLHNDADAHLSHNAFNATQLSMESLDAPHAFRELSGTDDSMNLFRFLRTVPHLYMLPTNELKFLAQELYRREFGALDLVLDRNQPVHHVYIVLQGEVEVFQLLDENEDTVERVGTVPCTNMFAFESVIFGKNSQFVYRAGSHRTVLALMRGQTFLTVLKKNLAMSQSIGRKMSEHMDVFVVFKEFCRHIFAHESSQHEYLPLWNILASYGKLNNCIHVKMNSSTIDTNAWMYAIRRLPDNVTETFCFDLVRSLPPFIANRMRMLTKSSARSNAGDIKYINTKERRRCSWQLGVDGKTLVLLRDGFTDLLDFISCICIHIHESAKLRARLQGMVHPPAIDILDNVLQTRKGENETPELHNEILEKMPLSPEERQGIVKIWPTSALKRMYQVIMHREEYMLRVDSSVSKRFQTDPFHEWSLNLRTAVLHKLGLNARSPLPKELIIDILSSNTHCTKNCLSPFARRHRDDIIAYGQAKRKELFSLSWFNKEDLVYFLTPGYVAEKPALVEEFQVMLKDAGFEVMEDTAMTGLQVDIIPVSQLNMKVIDPILVQRKASSAGATHFILNMDFAFGAQADGITKALIHTFGHHIRSFSVLGKAGGLVGKRADIQLATHVLFSKSTLATEDVLDELRSCDNRDITVERLKELVGPDHDIHTGPVLTVPGTMLQNENLLQFYRIIWKCVGVEMEGSYFARQIREAQHTGLLRSDFKTRFAYYTSDLPLQTTGDAKLSTPMRPNEGVPPLYAIVRSFLENMLR